MCQGPIPTGQVGLLPLCAVTVFEGERRRRFPEATNRLREFLVARPELRAFIHDPVKTGKGGRSMSAPLNESRLRRVLTRMLDENEFLSPYGIRALLLYHMYYGDDFTIDCPTGSGRKLNLYRVAEEVERRLTSSFLFDREGRRPVSAGAAKFQEDRHWREHILFYEYFHGDTGAGLGASHQTGWTGVVARIMHLFATTTAQQALELGKAAAFRQAEPAIVSNAAT